MRGKFITIEGQDGAGKSTNLAVVETFLTYKGIDYISSREPGGTPFGERLRELLLNSKDAEFGDMAELLLVFSARAQHIEQVIEPALAAGKWVLCDRFTDATFAYQGAGRGVDVSAISNLQNLVQGALTPDLTLVLDLPVEVGQSRAGQRSEPDRFELQQLDFKQKVRDCYLARANAEPSRMKVVDASLGLKQVESQVLSSLELFWEAHG